MLMKLSQLFRKKWHKKMLSGVEMVQIRLLDRLAKRYEANYGRETADLLAAAVVNRLFSHQPSDDVFVEFAESYKDTVKQEIHSLFQDKDMGHIVSHALRVQAQVAREQNKHSHETSLEPYERLKEYGMLATEEEMLTPHAFLHMARGFYQLRL
jgi:hypothetical protein